MPCEGGVTAYSKEQALEQLQDLPGWELREEGKILRIAKKYRLRNFIEAMEFANAIGGIAESEGHHPDLLIGYGRTEVMLWTHAIKGLSENDFILAAKIDALKIL